MNKDNIINLFRKIIASLTCIEKTINEIDLKNEVEAYIQDLVIQYMNIVDTNNINNIKFQFKEEDLIDFSYRCIENKKYDLVRLSEDVQFGIIELNKIINKI